MAALQLRRGLKANLPLRAAVGEPLIATDTREIYIGAGLLETDPLVYKLSDVIVSTVQPDLAINADKIWVNPTTNAIYRADVSGGSWVQVGGVNMLSDITLGGGAATDAGVPTQKAVKTYIDTAVAGLAIPTEWPDSVLEYIADPPVAPVDGARYLVKAVATGAFIGYENSIATYVAASTSWVFTAPTNGTFISVDNEAAGLYYFGGTSWVIKAFEANTAGPGIAISNGVVSINADTIVDPSGAGGLTYDPVLGQLAVGTIDGGTF